MNLTSLPEGLDPEIYEIHRGLICSIKNRHRQNVSVRRYPEFPLTGAVCLDIGACIGAFTRFCLVQGAAQVIACEPDPVNYQVFSLNYHYLGWQDRVYPYDRAAGWHPEILNRPPDEWPTRPLYIPRGDDRGTSSCISQRGRQIVQVPILDFQSLIYQFQPYLIKVNAEGIEYELFNSALVIPDCVRAIFIYFHGWRESWQERAVEITAQMQTWGFQPAYLLMPTHTPGYGTWVR